MRIETAGQADYKYILEHDHHLPRELIGQKINQQEIYIFRDDQNFNMGWLRYSYFWDNIPFMNMLWLDEAFRCKGLGRQAVLHWEQEMVAKGFRKVMTSTLSNEEAQHFYRRLGYKDSGSLILPNEPLEIIFTKLI